MTYKSGRVKHISQAASAMHLRQLNATVHSQPTANAIRLASASIHQTKALKPHSASADFMSLQFLQLPDKAACKHGSIRV